MVSPSIDLSRIPEVIPNLVGGKEAAAADGRSFSKLDPATGREICQVARSGADDIGSAVACAKAAQPAWAETRRCGAATSCARSPC